MWWWPWEGQWGYAMVIAVGEVRVGVVARKESRWTYDMVTAIGEEDWSGGSDTIGKGGFGVMMVIGGVLEE